MKSNAEGGMKNKIDIEPNPISQPGAKKHPGSSNALETNNKTFRKQENIYFLVERRVEKNQGGSISTEIYFPDLVKLGNRKEDESNGFFYMVERNVKDVNKLHKRSSAKKKDKSTEFYWVKVGNQDEEEDDSFSHMVKVGNQNEEENNSFCYMVQRNCSDQEKPGYLPFRDYHFYLGKRIKEKKKDDGTPKQESKYKKGKEEKEKEKKYDGKTPKQESEDKADKSKVFKMEEINSSETKGKIQNEIKNLSSDQQQDKMKSTEITKAQKEFISESFEKDQIWVYQMNEMETEDADRIEILSFIPHLRWNICDIMKAVIKKTISLGQLLYKQTAQNCQLQDKVNCIEQFFPILIIVMLIAASMLIFFSVYKDDNKSCEIFEALETLNINFTVICKYQDVKDCLQAIFGISVGSCVLDVLLLSLSLMIKFSEPKMESSTCAVIRAIAIVLLGTTFSTAFLITHNGITDYNTQQTENNYANIKNFMEASLTQDFTSDSITSSGSRSDQWNRFFIKYDCCAVKQVTSTANDFDSTPWCTTAGSCQQTNSQIPKTCCKDVTEEDYQSALPSCHATVTSGTYKDGCFAQVKKLNDETLTKTEVDILFFFLIFMEISKLLSVFLGGICIFGICCNKVRRQENIPETDSKDKDEVHKNESKC